MTQLDLLEPRKIAPSVNTQAHTLLHEFYTGRRLTVAEALTDLGIYALSQRVGELKRLGWPIKSRTLKSNGKHFSEYWIDFQ